MYKNSYNQGIQIKSKRNTERYESQSVNDAVSFILLIRFDPTDRS